MGLDDFTGNNSLSDEHKERREELSHNSPPGEASTWKLYEPGTPSWLEFIQGNSEDDKVIIQIAGADSTRIESDSTLDLDKCR